MWANKSMTPATFKTGPAGVSQLALSYDGTHVAVVTTDGAASVWTASGKRVARVTGATKAVAFGPTDDLLLIADGKGVRMSALAALAK